MYIAVNVLSENKHRLAKLKHSTEFHNVQLPCCNFELLIPSDADKSKEPVCYHQLRLGSWLLFQMTLLTLSHGDMKLSLFLSLLTTSALTDGAATPRLNILLSYNHYYQHSNCPMFLGRTTYDDTRCKALIFDTVIHVLIRCRFF